MKVAICIPCYGDTKLGFTLGLASMCLYSSGAQIALVSGSSSNLPWLRCDLAKKALESGAEYILWLDSDHTFPHDTLARLLSHNLPIVGANYPTRNDPKRPTATLADDCRICTTESDARRGRVSEVESMGLGVCLIKSEVFRAIDEPYFASLPEGGEFVGEDVYFFRKARTAGFRPHVDHRLSWQVGHISQTILTNAETKGRPVHADSVRSLAGFG